MISMTVRKLVDELIANELGDNVEVWIDAGAGVLLGMATVLWNQQLGIGVLVPGDLELSIADPPSTFMLSGGRSWRQLEKAFRRAARNPNTLDDVAAGLYTRVLDDPTATNVQRMEAARELTDIAQRLRNITLPVAV